MEEKEDALHSRVRSISGRWNIPKLFLFPYSSPKNSGFTLVELLISIAVIGVLGAAVIVILNPVGQMNKSKDARRKSDIKQIQTALELYRSDCGSYPTGSLGTSLTGSCTGATTTYMQTVPKDPKGASYNYAPTGNTYSITICAENENEIADNITVFDVPPTTCTSRKQIRGTNP